MNKLPRFTFWIYLLAIVASSAGLVLVRAFPLRDLDSNTWFNITCGYWIAHVILAQLFCYIEFVRMRKYIKRQHPEVVEKYALSHYEFDRQMRIWSLIFGSSNFNDENVERYKINLRLVMGVALLWFSVPSFLFFILEVLLFGPQ